MNDARPGANFSGAPHSSDSENEPGPGSSAACALPSAMSGSGRPATLASMSVAPDIRPTRVMPARSTSPVRLKTPWAVSRSTRTRRSALESTDATGATAGPCDGRLARSIRRLYSASESVTARGDSFGRGGCCAEAAWANATKTAASAYALDLVMISSSLA